MNDASNNKTTTKTLSFDIGDKVRKKTIGNGFVHGVVVDPLADISDDSEDVCTVVWYDGPIERSQEHPHQLMKEEDFIFEPNRWRPTGAANDFADNQIHTVPLYDHRNKTKFKVGDSVVTPYGPAKVINTAKTPVGSMYRVEMIHSGNIYDLLEDEVERIAARK